MSIVFIMVGKNDKPIYELEMGDVRRVPGNDQHLSQFVIHSALDVVEETQWLNTQMYLKVVDQYKNMQVSCFVSSGYVKFMLLHTGKGEDPIKNFFLEVHELYLKIIMNPFYEPNTPIQSSIFNERVKAIAQRRLF